MPVHTPAAPGVTRLSPPRESSDNSEPDDRETDPNGAVYQQPLYLSDLRPPPGEPIGRHARADTPPPQPGQRAPELGPDGREVRIGAVEVPESMRVPPPDRRLPVRVDKAEGRRSWQPLVLVAVLIAGIAVAAAVVVATLPRVAGAPTTGASTPAAPAPALSSATPPPSSPAPSASAGPNAGRQPQDLRLQDNRDSVSLAWRYPKGSEGPILISGGRAGQEQRAFQQLPAGTTNYVVYGLNEQLDYCFTVAIVYAADRVAKSPQLCTKRR
jgi:hypothetical protein